MDHAAIWIRFPDIGVAAELEVMAPVGTNVDVCRVLDRLGVASWSPHSLETDQRVFAFAKLTEPDGSGLSEHRAWQVLRALRIHFGAQRSGGERAVQRRSGAYRMAQVDRKAAG
jgi:hypothetical protein